MSQISIDLRTIVGCTFAGLIVIAAVFLFLPLATGDAGVVEDEQNAVDFDGSGEITMADVPSVHTDMVVTDDEKQATSERYVNTVSSLSPIPGRSWELYRPQYYNTSRMYEVSRHPTQKVTISQLNNAWKLYNQTYIHAEESGLFSGVPDDYRKVDQLHYVNLQLLHNTEDLNTRAPESLLYRQVNTSNGGSEQRLVGAMYLRNDFNHGEQVGGPLTVWHWHELSVDPACANTPTTRLVTENLTDSEVQSVTPSNWNECDTRKSRTPEMLHVWFEKRPLGPFSTAMVSKKQPPSKYDKMNKSEFISYTLDRYAKHYQNSSVNVS